VFASSVIVMPMVAIATTAFGADVIQRIFGIDPTLADRVQAYLILMCPLILLNAQRHYFNGLLIQARRTGWVTIFNLVYLAIVVTSLVVGFQLAMEPRLVIVGADIIGVCALLILLVTARFRIYQLPDVPEHEEVTYWELVKFFIPVSTTGVMVALSRPVLFAFVARTPDGLLTIAALRIAFDFSMIFQQAANQFRHFFISFGFDDLRRKQLFMAVIAAGLTLFMLVFALTPLADWVWGRLMGLPPGLMQLAVDVALIMCLMPAAIVYRNYFHSRLMHMRRTAGMAYGSVARVVSIFAMAATLFGMQALNHTTAALALILGFVVEALIAQWAHHHAETKAFAQNGQTARV
jgi:hypothetical protein